MIPISRPSSLFATFTFCISFFGLAVIHADEASDVKSHPPIVPRWALEPWVWEDNGNNQDAVFKIVDEYRKHKIPTGVVMIDSPWETSYHDMIWDKKRYPDAQGMINRLKAKGLRVVLWTTGSMNYASKDTPNKKSKHYDFVVSKHYAVNDGKSFTWWKGDGVHLDFTNRAAVDWYGGIMGKIMDMGVDGWKVDQSPKWLPGKTVKTSVGTIPKSKFKRIYYAALHDIALKHNPESLILARPYSWQGGFSSDINTCTLGWCGDFHGDFSGLQLQMDNLYRSANAGYGALAVEIGGYQTVNPTKNSLIRYTQFGALMPGMENGGSNGGLTAHLPWHWDRETVDIYRYYATLHSELVPFIFSESVACHLTGKPIVKNADISTASHKLGNDIFVAPVVKDGANVRKKITLPDADHWIDYWNEDGLLAPSASFTLDVPLKRIPIYLRAGAIVPMHIKNAITNHGDATSENRESVIIYPYENSSYLYHRPRGSGIEYDDVRIGMNEKTGDLTVRGSVSASWRFRIKSFSAPAHVEGADQWHYDKEAKTIIIDKRGASFAIRIQGLKGYSGKK